MLHQTHSRMRNDQVQPSTIDRDSRGPLLPQGCSRVSIETSKEARKYTRWDLDSPPQVGVDGHYPSSSPTDTDATPVPPPTAPPSSTSIEDLPSEILAEICKHTHSAEASGDATVLLPSFTTAYAFSCVNHRFQAALIEYLSPWSAIHIKVMGGRVMPSPEVIEAHIRNSGQFPLSWTFTVVLGRQSNEKTFEAARSTFKQLSQAAERWECVRLNVTPWHEDQCDLFPDPEVTLSSLVALEVMGTIRIGDTLNLLRRVGKGQNLRQLTVDTQGCSVAGSIIIPLPTHNLLASICGISTLHINLPILSSAIHLLRNLPTLEVFSAQFFLGYTASHHCLSEKDIDSTITSVRLSRLHTLRFRLINSPWSGAEEAYPDSSIIALFQNLDLPALRNLSIVESGAPWGDHMFGISPLISRSTCGIERLELNRTRIGPTELIDCLTLPSAQSITHLHLEDPILVLDRQVDWLQNPTLTEEVFAALSYPTSQPFDTSAVKLPQLATLIVGIDDSDAVVNPLVDMLHSRLFADLTGSPSVKRLEVLGVASQSLKKAPKFQKRMKKIRQKENRRCLAPLQVVHIS
ncbi:hypothetical protein HGRIS_002552 [Hohenbuehelia grisea]|uniref:F-box domain-containing protein n=1 Tax=Hohenbuehelia grisea TaxID=104357 RepID=A0ABR3JKT5_9AGAR